MSAYESRVLAARATAHPELRPSGHHLMLLLHAAVVDDYCDGPFLSITRDTLPDGSPLYHHTVRVTLLEWFNDQQLVMLNGNDALAFAHVNKWPSIVMATPAELRALGQYAITLHDTPGWAGSYNQWMKNHLLPGPTQTRRDRSRKHRADAWTMRRHLAEQCMSRPKA
jgi:hypothetical protein